MRQRITEVCKKGGYGLEVGEQGTPHLQGSIWLKRKNRITNLKKLTGFERMHFEEMRNEQASIEYFKKDGDYWMYGFPPEPRIDTFIKTITLNTWQQEALKIHLTEPDRRTIHFWIGANVGKTTFMKYMIMTYPNEVKASTCENSSDVILMAEDWVKTYIINYPKEVSHYPYKALEQLKDGFTTTAKLRKTQKVCCQAPPHVFVMCNHEPDQTALTEDRFNVKFISE